MNANELADLLETTESTNNKAATMLRQQQEQINNLKQWERRHLDVIHSLERQLEVIREACARSRP
jgi:septal ring factor EnvC (AmiA/AmiB activator)